ncbi:MAG: hemerythrin family protein [Pseudomonadota bacterium]
MKNYPQVALEFMNQDHAEFVALVYTILELLEAPSSEPAVDLKLSWLLAHTRHHFAEEERKMQETHFPPYLMHKMEHDRVLADMESHIEDWLAKRDAVALQNWMQKDVASWFLTHVATMDFVTAGFIAAQQHAK